MRSLLNLYSFPGIVGSICKALEIPNIIAHWAPEPLGGRNESNTMTLNIYPDSDVLSRTLSTLIVDYTWKSFTIIYENDDSECTSG